MDKAESYEELQAKIDLQNRLYWWRHLAEEWLNMNHKKECPKYGYVMADFAECDSCSNQCNKSIPTSLTSPKA